MLWHGNHMLCYNRDEDYLDLNYLYVVQYYNMQFLHLS